jgi:hypothetical protein
MDVCVKKPRIVGKTSRAIQEKIFSKVMEMAELVNLEKKDRKAYEESLKNYLDLKNALDSSEEKGIENTTINFYKAGAPL